MINELDNIPAIELNVSCPNVRQGGMAFGVTCSGISQVVAEVRKAYHKHLMVKLSPNVTNIAEIATAAEASGADSVSLINTLLGMRIDIKSKRPVIANTMGGFSGPAIFPVALRMVYQVAHAVSVPVVGIGGVSSAEDVLEMMMAGATCVEIGAANLTDPFICRDIIQHLPAVMDKYGIQNIKDIIGGAQ